MLVPHCFDYCSFTESFEIRKCASSNFVLLFQPLAILSPLTLHMNFRNGLSISTKKSAWHLVGIGGTCRPRRGKMPL